CLNYLLAVSVPEKFCYSATTWCFFPRVWCAPTSRATRRTAQMPRASSRLVATKTSGRLPVKSIPQRTLTSLCRMRQGWTAERTACLNTFRGLLRELGHFIPVGANQVVPAVWTLIEDADADLPDALRPLFAEACQEIRDLEASVGILGAFRGDLCTSST